MKIGCHCGKTIVDQTDDLSDKARLVPDQEWQHVLDRLEADVIDGVGEGTLDRESAYMKMRSVIGNATRLIWQCRYCGRLYVNDRDGVLQCYVPSTDETEREVLRNRASGRPDQARQ